MNAPIDYTRYYNLLLLEHDVSEMDTWQWDGTMHFQHLHRMRVLQDRMVVCQKELQYIYSRINHNLISRIASSDIPVGGSRILARKVKAPVRVLVWFSTLYKDSPCLSPGLVLLNNSKFRAVPWSASLIAIFVILLGYMTLQCHS